MRPIQALYARRFKIPIAPDVSEKGFLTKVSLDF